MFSVCFYSRLSDNRTNHDSGVQIVERGGSGERVKLYTGSGRVGGGGEGKSNPSPSKLPAFFFLREFFSRALLSERPKQATRRVPGESHDPG